MEGWKELVLNLVGLPEGVTEIKTTVTTGFTTQFEQSPIGESSYDVQVLFDKKPGLYILDIFVTGWYETACDRCLEQIKVPSSANYQYFFNHKKTAGETENEDVFVLDEGAIELDLRPLVYETIVLSLPMINVYDCENDDEAPCDKKVLEILQDKKEHKTESTNSMWDMLKDINFED